MKKRNTVRTAVKAALLAFVAVAIGYAVIRETGSGPERPAAGEPTPSAGVIAYYFHGDVRCATCRKIEAYTAECITHTFSNAITAGHLQWRIVNVDEPEHRHFIDDYELTTRSVVLSHHAEGQDEHWKNLESIWDLVQNKALFQQYIIAETRQFLSGAKP